MATSPYMFVCLCCFFLVNCEVREVNNESYDSEIAAVLNYLNSTPFRVYNYKQASLLNAHKKKDITELALDIDVDCINKYPDVPCSEKLLTCSAFVQNTPEKGSQVLNDVNCKPKPEIIIEEPTYERAEVVVNETKTIALSNEAVSSEVGEPFVAVKKESYPCLGCPFDLNPEVEGVDELIDIALEHVGSERDKKQALVKVLKLQQQVVSGVKYFLLVELAPTICAKDANLDSCPRDTSDSYLCEIVYLQKPWISRTKHIISNNCTVSQEYVKPDTKRSDMSNEIDSDNYRQNIPTPNFDHIAETGTMEQMSPVRLSDLESQILVESDDSIPMRAEPTVDSSKTEETETMTEESSTTERNDAGEDDASVEDRMKRSDESPESNERLNSTMQATNSSEESSSEEANKRVQRSANSSEEFSSEENNRRVRRSDESPESLEATLNATLSPKEESSEEKRTKRAIPQLEKISPEEKGLVRNLADFAAAALDNIDDDNHRRIILQILGAKKMVGDDGVYYHLIMRMGISRCLEDNPHPYENCREKLFENYTKICKVQVYVNDDFGSPKVVKSQCQNIKRDKNDSNRTNYSRFKRDVLAGGHAKIDKDSEKVKELVRQGVTHLNAQSKVDNKYKQVEVISATSQVVAGINYKIKVKIAESDCSKNDQKKLEECNIRNGASPTTCQIKVWEKSWQNFRKYTVECENGERVSVEAGINNKRKKRQVTGGENPVNKNDENIKNLLQQSVTHLNAQSNKNNKYKPVEVLSATQQVVAGFIYRINVKVAESDCSKNDEKKLEDCNILDGASPTTCNVEVWEKSWENFKQFTVKCENGENIKVKTGGRAKRQAPGGQFNIEVDSNVKELLRQGVTHLNAQTNKDNKYTPVEVVSVTRQVVAGLMYRIKVKVAESDCALDDDKDFEDCEIRDGATPTTCEVKIWEKGWENFRQFKVHCENGEHFKVVTSISHNKRDVGQYKRTKKDFFVEEYLESGLSQLDTRSPGDNKLKVDEILSVSKQTVAGHIYNIKAKVVLSDCDKNSDDERKSCGTLSGAVPQVCTFKVYEAIWRPNSRMINITCGEDQYSFGTIHKGLLGNDDPNLHFTLFNDFIKKYKKRYSGKKEFKYRLKVFSDNLMRVRLLNTYEQGSAWYGITKFADLTENEFSKSLGLRPDLRNENETPFAEAEIPDIKLPTEFDWRTKGVVTEVKNQEQCGSCWAFSVTGNVEGQYAIKHGKLLEFSEQELVDCDTEDQGCNGGLMDNAYREIEKMGGLETEQDYPYDAEDEKCHFNRSLARVELTGALNISHNETDMAKWLVANGPISIAINANAMQFYMGGVSHPFKFLCSPNNLDHGVLIVGYGVHTYPLFKKTLPYWIVKNSWGTSWGEQGYYRVYRGDGTCGLNQTPSSAIVA